MADFILVPLFTSCAAGDCAMGSSFIGLETGYCNVSLGVDKSTFNYEKGSKGLCLEEEKRTIISRGVVYQ